MADTWGDDGPPDDAYERHSRDLGRVTAAYAGYLDDLPGRMAATYLCEVREATEDEIAWLLDDSTIELDRAFAVDPGVDSCATMLVGRGRFEGGTTVEIGFGVETRALAPPCFCDACDEDSDSLIALTEGYVRIVTAGFREFRREIGLVPGGDLREGPWMESGYVWSGGSASGIGVGQGKAPFVREWEPWRHNRSSR